MALTSLTAPENSFRALWERPRYPGFILTVSVARISATMFNTAGVLLILVRTGSGAMAIKMRRWESPPRCLAGITASQHAVA